MTSEHARLVALAEELLPAATQSAWAVVFVARLHRADEHAEVLAVDLEGKKADGDRRLMSVSLLRETLRAAERVRERIDVALLLYQPGPFTLDGHLAMHLGRAPEPVELDYAKNYLDTINRGV